MPRRMGGKKYLVNTTTKEVHDLDNEHINCQINKIIDGNNDAYYDTLEQAHVNGYDNGHFCINGSSR